MFDKLDDLLRRFEEIMNELAEPGVTDNQKHFRELMKEQSDLTPLVEAYKEYKKCGQDVEDSLAMLEEESDEDMRDMLKEELSASKKRIEELENELKILLLPKDPNDDKNVIVEIRAGAGGDEAHGGDLTGLRDHAFAARDHEQLDARMREELLRHFDGGFLHGDEQVRDAGRFDDGLVQDLNGRLGRTLRIGVGSEDHGVAAGDHADGVVDDRGGRVGGRRHGSDHAPRSVFNEGQAHVAGNGHGGEAFGAGGPFANKDVLGDLVAYAAHARFVVGHFGEGLGVFKTGLADDGDDLVAHGDGGDLLLGSFGGLHGVFELIEEAEVAAVAAAGGNHRRRSRGRLIRHHLFENFNDNAFHVLLAHVHIYLLCWKPVRTPQSSRTAGRGACFFMLLPSGPSAADGGNMWGDRVPATGRTANRPAEEDSAKGAFTPDSCDTGLPYRHSHGRRCRQ